MKMFKLLQSDPIAPDTGESRYFIDGVRVTQDEYEKLQKVCCCFACSSYKFAGRGMIASTVGK